MALAPTAALADRAPPSTMPVRSIDRPITLLEDHFGLRPEVFGTRYNKDGLAGLYFGAGYGLDDDFELGLTLLRLTMSPDPDTGLDSPTAYAQYRLVSGMFELALRAELEMPLNDYADYRASVPMLVRLPPLLRLSIDPGVFGAFGSDTSVGVDLPAQLRVQLGDRFALDAYGTLGWPSLRASRTALVQVGGGLAFTIVRANAAAAEIRLRGFGPSIVVGDGASLMQPIGADWTAFIDATIYLRPDPDDAFPDSPF